MRILHIIHSLAGGGAERQLCEMLNQAEQTTMSMAVFCVNPCNREADFSEANLFVLSDASKYPWGLVGEVEKAIKTFRPDLIHCWLPVPVIVPAMIAAKKNGLPVVASYRNKKGFNGVYDFIEYWAVKLMASAIASNNPPEQSNSAFYKLFQNKISAYIPNSISNECSAQRGQGVKNNAQPFTILFVGRIFDAQKNWRTLLQGLKQVNLAGDWRLLICGDGKEKAELLVEINALGLEKQVEILGYRDDVYSIMAAADVLVLPSWHEGMPNVVVEAMALSLPCIVSDIPAHQSLFTNEAGVSYIDPADASTLTAVIDSMLEGRIDLKDMAAQGLVFSSRFTPAKLMESYEKLYDQTIASAIKQVVTK